jgi:hypothetical protein
VCGTLGRMSGPEHEGSDLVTGPTHSAVLEPSMSVQSTPAPAVYKEIPGFSGYRVGSDGSVWTCKVKGGNDRAAGRRGPWRLLSVHRSKTGYCLVNLDRGGHNHVRQVHRLVLELFVGPRPEGMEACHYPDPDKANNRVENLRWDTHGENAKDRYRDRGTVTEKCCRRCGQTRPLSEFCRDKRSTDGHGQRCRACRTKGSAERFRRDPEARARRRAYNREYMRRWKAGKKGGGK